MLRGLLLCSHATGTFGRRRIEQSPYDSVPVRLPTADTHPDHDTLRTFRRENQALPTERFVKGLALARQLKVLKLGRLTVAAAGTKVLASASQHSAVSSGRAGELIEQLELGSAAASGQRRVGRCHTSAGWPDHPGGNHPAPGAPSRAGAGPGSGSLAEPSRCARAAPLAS